ncbi:CZB domain-containing protein [Aliidiomarina quisquiliarum]|uniref:CZB domain-containing protein n=1 Tax=Aliidiomarina quisquiliarum TaxID=2938947 RepID=UPI00208E0D66|nr:CZB domain-containing protein [Aliidiomarina quisquiliarum]MCO4321352.1 CZB domain-containing protein [Aliidiomarina quisquiliarum]
MPADDFPRWAQHWQAPPSWLGQPPVEAHNLPLLYAEVEHRSWIIALEQWLCGELKNPPVLDRHHCKLGVWIDSEANSRFGLQAKFSNLEKLHHDIHQLGQSAISLYTQDQAEAAKKLLPQLWHLRDLFMDELKSLIG